MTIPAYSGLGEGWINDLDDPRLAVLWPGHEDYDGVNSISGILFVLNAARIQCETFAPSLPDGAVVPENWVAAQVLQARALVRAGISDSNDQAGLMGEGVTLFPMDWTVKNLLRPRGGRPRMGRRWRDSL